MLKFVNNKLIAFFVVMLVVVVAAGVVVSDKAVNIEIAEHPFLEGLQGNVEEVGTIVLQKKGKTTTIRKKDDKWILPGKYGYIVDLPKIRELVVNAEKLKIAEKKTDNPDKHDAIGLGSVEDEDSVAVRVLLMDATENVVFADFVRGYQRDFGQAGEQKAIYVRNWNENETWLAKGDFVMSFNANALLNKEAFNIDADRIMKVSFFPSTGANFEISRLPKTDFNLTRPSKKAKSHNELNKLGAILSGGLVFEDVLPDSSMPFTRKLTSKIVYTTFDGIQVTLEVLVLEEEGVWLQISAEAKNNSKENEAKMINLVAKGWVYRVSDSSANRLTVRLDSLVSE